MSKTAPAGGRKVTFNVSEQYEIQEIVGEGAYGVVWYKALQRGTKRRKADIAEAQHCTSHHNKRLPSRRSHHSTTPCSACEHYVR